MSTARGAIRLGAIRCVTIVAQDLAHTEALYARELGYRCIGRGEVSPALAALWGTADEAGARTLLMAPPAGDEFTFRFIERAAGDPWQAFTRHGWNAIELMVEHVDSLAAQLAGSGFETIAPPLDLSFCPNIRAMQVRGPSGEILYLTEFKRPVQGLPVPMPRCAVDRAFIVIVGGASLDTLQQWYTRQFAVPEVAAMESRVQTMALAFDLPRETRFRIAALPLAGDCYIEADEMPPAAHPLPQASRRLPAGIAMVSFNGELAGGAVVPDDTPPYAGSTAVQCIRGAAGELIEVIGPG